MLVIGLTGGIGSGKSAVTKLFAELGAPIIDTDILARDVTNKGEPGLTDIVEHFGKDILQQDGTLNRGKLRDLIFANPEERTWLENLLHPLIIDRIRMRLDDLSAPYVIVVIPLLFETSTSSLLDRILVVDTTEDNQIARTMARDQLSRESVQAIINTQVSRDTRLYQADDIIENNASLDSLRESVEKLHQSYLALAKAT